jgi:hypothetical protein
LNGRISQALEMAYRFEREMKRPLDAWFCLGDMLGFNTEKDDEQLIKDILRGLKKGTTIIMSSL